MIPPLCGDTGCLPLGRYAATLEEIEMRFVRSQDFSNSATRAEVWREWNMHRQLIEAATGMTPRAWLAGSFVSSKLDPSDIDVFYGIDSTPYDRIPQEDLEDLENLAIRDWCVRHGMRVDSHVTRLPKSVPVKNLMPSLLSERDKIGFQSLGIFDEIWQRCKGPSAPVDGERSRGYPEVIL